MAEERILIEILPPASGFGSCGGFYTEGVGEYFCCWNGGKERVTEEICNICPHDKSMTRQEAIERIAKGMYLLTNPEDTKYADFYNCYFFELAEAALNALLGEQ